MSKMVGRADDMLVIRGVNVYPSEIEAVVLPTRRRTAVSPGGRRHVGAAPAGGLLRTAIVDVDAEDAAYADARALWTAGSAACDVVVAATGSLPRTEVGKAQRLIRW